MRTKIFALQKESVAEIARFAVLLSVATLVPLVGHQFIVGPVVNAVLFLSLIFLGVQGAVLIAVVPSVIALSIGLLPPVLVPMVPFIMTGNIILVLVFHYFQSNFWKGVVFASFLKFSFLFATSSVVINLIIKEEIIPRIALMMSWPQLLTALAGGTIAYFICRISDKKQIY